MQQFLRRTRNYDDLNQNIKVGNPLKQKFCIERFLNKKECEIIIKKSEELGEWTTKRHKNYTTTDISIKSIPGLDKIKKLCIKANKSMWNFNILNIKGSFTKLI